MRFGNIVSVIWASFARIWFNKIVRRNTQETVRNKQCCLLDSVIRATIAFYIAIRLDEYFKPTLGFRAHWHLFTNLTIRVRWIDSTNLSIRVRWTDPTFVSDG